jgi:hypothetical protein
MLEIFETNFAVWNAKKAESKGVEFDLNTPLWVPGLSIDVSGAYANATFTEDYTIIDSSAFRQHCRQGRPAVAR